MQQTGKLVLIMGPSGVGKSVILNELRSKHPEWHFPRSATTRHRREGEGDDLYRFISDKDFDELVQNGQVLEWAVVHGGARYGTLIEEIIPPIERGQIVVREVDVQGFDSIRTHTLFRGKDAPYTLQSIFIIPENKAQLIERITRRSPISQEELNHRIASMEKELTYADRCDATITNAEGRLEQALQNAEKIIS